MISFLDVKVIKNGDGTFETDVHRKKTDTNVYMHWDSFAPRAWKIGTMKSLIRRAHIICSKPEFLQKEMEHLKAVFQDVNGFPSRVIHTGIEQVRRKIEQEGAENQVVAVTDEVEAEKEVTPFI